MLASIFLSLRPSKVELLTSFFSFHFMFALFFLLDSEKYSSFSPRLILSTLVPLPLSLLYSFPSFLCFQYLSLFMHILHIQVFFLKIENPSLDSFSLKCPFHLSSSSPVSCFKRLTPLTTFLGTGKIFLICQIRGLN